MKKTMLTEKIVFCRLARAAARPAPGAAGSASPPLTRFAAFANTTFWFFQMTIHTLAAIVIPRTMPTRIAALWPGPNPFSLPMKPFM